MSTKSAAGGAQREHWIHQPVLHTPYDEPDRHWGRDDGDDDRAPVAGRLKPDSNELNEAFKNTGRSLLDDQDSMVATLRQEVRGWRSHGWPDSTTATRRLLEYWSRPPGEGPVQSPFFAQREAVETIVYLTEIGNGSHLAVKRLQHLRRMLKRMFGGSADEETLNIATGTMSAPFEEPTNDRGEVAVRIITASGAVMSWRGMVPNAEPT